MSSYPGRPVRITSAPAASYSVQRSMMLGAKFAAFVRTCICSGQCIQLPLLRILLRFLQLLLGFCCDVCICCILQKDQRILSDVLCALPLFQQVPLHNLTRCLMFATRAAYGSIVAAAGF